MKAEKLNPDSTILNQLEGQWEAICRALLWKLLKKGERVTITMNDMLKITTEAQCGNAILFVHGHVDSMEFGLVTRDEADILAEHDRRMRESQTTRSKQ